jgi:hypothetical protein
MSPRPDDAGDDLGITIPDDASELESERLRYLDEQARGVGRSEPDWSLREPTPQLPRLFGTRRWRRYGLSGPLVVAVLVVVALAGSLMTVLRPAVGDIPRPLPLAEPAVAAAPGTSGGLLPDAPVTLDSVPLPMQALRPTVLVVVPAECPTCADVVRELDVQTREFRLRSLLLGDPGRTDQLGRISLEADKRLTSIVLDTTRALTTLYPGPGPTLVFVHADGIIADVVSDPSPTTRYEGLLAELAAPGAAGARV